MLAVVGHDVDTVPSAQGKVIVELDAVTVEIVGGTFGGGGGILGLR